MINKERFNACFYWRIYWFYDRFLPFSVEKVWVVVDVEWVTSDIGVVVSGKVAAVAVCAVFFNLVDVERDVINNVEAAVGVEVATVTSVGMKSRYEIR